MLKATPAGLAEQAAGGGGSRKRQKSKKKGKAQKGNNAEKAKSRKTARTARPVGARWRKKGGAVVGKKKSRGIGGGTRVRVAQQRGLEVSDQNCSQLGLDPEASKSHLRVKPRASSSK